MRVEMIFPGETKEIGRTDTYRVQGTDQFSFEGLTFTASKIDALLEGRVLEDASLQFTLMKDYFIKSDIGSVEVPLLEIFGKDGMKKAERSIDVKTVKMNVIAEPINE